MAKKTKFMSLVLPEDDVRRLLMICNAHLSESAQRLEDQGMGPEQIRKAQLRDLQIKRTLATELSTATRG